MQLGDLPEMDIKDGKAEFESFPTMVKVRKTLSKNGNSYTTFLCEEGCGYLKEYLQWRMLKGEKLSAKSPIITPVHANLVGEFIRAINIGDLIRKAIRSSGFQWRPYVLRRYFDTRLMMAESDGLIIRDYRVYWMGHKLDIEFVYTVSKGLSKDVLEKMRLSYSKAAEKYLMTTKREGVSKQDMVETFNSQFLRMAGYSDEELAKMDLANVSTEQIQELIRNKSMEMLGLSGNHQKIVPLLELRNFIVQGWEFVRELPNNEAIIRLPNSD